MRSAAAGPLVPPGRWKTWAGLAAFALAYLWAIQRVEISAARLVGGLPLLARILGLMLSPDWSWLGRSVAGMAVSVQIAVLGTTTGMVLAVPLAFVAAANIGRPAASLVGKQLLNLIRTFPEIILAVFFVAAYGPGPLAGMMAIGLHSSGSLGKLYAEVVETIDPGPLEALRAAGATRWRVFRFAVLPQVLPEFLALSLYRLEINARAASVLGLVGAGGIGTLLVQALQFRRWEVVGVALLVIVVAVVVIDTVSAALRRRLV
ncbi:MAG: phosphonate ABC transporter, permease protein PhnE [Armatimonadota bacterium]|nr:phosphonate ABC transporter, permease protein PhnE [Armatimonadota bacterium]MDR7484961.1 phosphonate ABC transporter, permease protein PhnE [Armatimonadota bacterium]MDR7533664.1 phosphonate ABC transporter, permease protein PhnE [Armatimonadota bacterium]MDR7535475.1 phosphonate ABC transporter, permease protein PhnE [Armatimonadota bacterium]